MVTDGARLAMENGHCCLLAVQPCTWKWFSANNFVNLHPGSFTALDGASRARAKTKLAAPWGGFRQKAECIRMHVENRHEIMS